MKREYFRVIAAVSILLISLMTVIARASVSEKNAAIAYTDEQKLIKKQKAEALEGSLRFQRMEPNDVNNIELCIFDWEKEKKTRLSYSFRKAINKEVIEGLLTLCKKATPTIHHDHPRPNFDFIMEVEPKKGDTFEIPFRLSFSMPFGGLDSPELMEALYALTHGCTGNIINFNQGKILEVVKFRSGGGLVGGCYSSILLNKEGQIMLTIQMSRLREDAPPQPRDRPLTDEERQKRYDTIDQSIPVRYGQVQLLEHNGKGYMILNVFNPFF